jgi:hypothetical protein
VRASGTATVAVADMSACSNPEPQLITPCAMLNNCGLTSWPALQRSAGHRGCISETVSLPRLGVCQWFSSNTLWHGLSSNKPCGMVHSLHARHTVKHSAVLNPHCSASVMALLQPHPHLLQHAAALVCQDIFMAGQPESAAAHVHQVNTLSLGSCTTPFGVKRPSVTENQNKAKCAGACDNMDCQWLS